MASNLRDSLVSPDMLKFLREKFAHLPYRAVGLRVEELLKFLTLAAKFEAGPLPISPELDKLWHLFILETKEYASLCAKLGKFIHHTALNSAQHNTLAHVDSDLLFIVSYVKEFGPFSPDVCFCWNAVTRLMDYLSLDLAGLNRFALELAAEPHFNRLPYQRETNTCTFP